jgi:hypothetical protein
MASIKLEQDYYELTGNRLSNTSFLKLFNILEDSDGEKFLNIFRFYSINENVMIDIMNYITYEVRDDDWPELIAYIIYDNLNLWWLIYLSNNILNPFEGFDIGQNIKILKDGYLPMIIREMRNVAEE